MEKVNEVVEVDVSGVVLDLADKLKNVELETEITKRSSVGETGGVEVEMGKAGSVEECKTYTLDDLIPPEPLEAVADNETFIIIGNYHERFPEFHVMVYDAFEEDLFHLREEILEVVQSNAKLSEMPKQNDVVLALSESSVYKYEYHRALVLKTDADGADVYFVDLGEYGFVNGANFKPVSKQVMEIPVLGYPVCLDGYLSKSSLEDELIYINDFEDEMRDLRGKQWYLKCVGSSNPDFIDVLTGEKPKVVLILDRDAKGIKHIDSKPSFLVDRLKLLSTMKWTEHILQYPDKSWNDEAISEVCDKWIWSQQFTQMYSPPVDSGFMAQVTRVVPGDEMVSGERQAILHLILLDEPIYSNKHRVLHGQIKRYCDLIEKSQFCPSIQETALLKIDDIEENTQLGINGVGMWSRAIRVNTDYFYMLDWDDHIKLDALDSSTFEIRKMHSEFRSVESLVVKICPLVNGEPMPFENAKKVFQKKMRYHFRVVRSRAEDLLEAEYTS